MKRKILSIIVAIALLLSLCSFNAFASETVSVYLDNELLQFDVEPKTINGYTMVPMRTIFEKLGATVTWDNSTNTAHAYDYDAQKGVSISVGAPHMIDIYMNVIKLEVPAIIENGRTLVPLRAVSEAFKCDVQWDGDTNTVKIFSEDFTEQSTDAQEEVKVSTAEQFINSIGSNKKIILTSDYYNLSTVKKVDNKYVDKQFNRDDKYPNAYVIKNVVNMTIEGPAEIVIDDIYGDVLSFEKCKQITLSGLTIGHTDSYDQYQCEGAVTKFTDCDGVYLNNCNLYGCGAFGVYGDKVTNLNIADSEIYDCTYTGIWLTEESNAIVSKTDFFDSEHTSGFLRIDNSTISCIDCNIHDITCNGFGRFIDTFDFGGKPSDISFSGCRFINNEFDSITNDDGNKKITFNNCTLRNNIGNLEHSSVVYNNSVVFNPETTTMPQMSKKSSSDDRELFLEYLALGINYQYIATYNLSNYVEYNSDERFEKVFYENLYVGYVAVASAYKMSLEYTDMNALSEPLEKVLNIYDAILDGGYTPTTVADMFEETLNCYEIIADKVK